MPQYQSIHPNQSLTGSNPAISRTLQLEFYLRELERQAKIATRAFSSAWTTGMIPETQLDLDQIDLVWADLQAMMFSAIVVERFLCPNIDQIRKSPEHTAAELKQAARSRRDDLIELLGIPDDAEMFRVTDVRNALEHIDERFDSLILRGVTSVSDWNLVYGEMVRTPPKKDPAELLYGVTLRVFCPPAGCVFFDGTWLDLYQIDRALTDLRAAIPAARETLQGRRQAAKTGQEGEGRFTFGGQQLVQLDTASWEGRIREFCAHRSENGDPVDLSRFPFDPPDQQPS